MTTATRTPAPSRSQHVPSKIGALAGFLALLAVGFMLSLAVGSRNIPLLDVWHALTNISTLRQNLDSIPQDELTIAALRFPRTLLAILVGTALGVAGALIQGHTRNPLADPGILGVSAGAALAVVLSSVFLGVTSVSGSAMAAFIGAGVATLVVFSLASVGNGHVNPLNLVLGGAALSAVMGAVTTTFVLIDERSLDQMRFWNAGSVAGRDLDVFWGVLPFVGLGLLLAFASAPGLNLLTMGEDVAGSLGVNVQRSRMTGMTLIALLAGAATAAAGPIGFLALVVPHIARAICGPDYRWILPLSGVIGANLLVYADIVGRLIARPAEVQVGIVLAFIGAPFFIWMMYKNRVISL
ncbi:iron ABC transporter permease [uncultured Corynebacterium sp.]|uniref:FecCD family ABC transporter permease n=1 Tax=uncultured Corynebacterium sp. TaxID=159447 RepID=UPI00260ABD50|nr:iron ABC transporter permease [uncultured Corynebacterium sp.]